MGTNLREYTATQFSVTPNIPFEQEFLWHYVTIMLAWVPSQGFRILMWWHCTVTSYVGSRKEAKKCEHWKFTCGICIVLKLLSILQKFVPWSQKELPGIAQWPQLCVLILLCIYHMALIKTISWLQYDTVRSDWAGG